MNWTDLLRGEIEAAYGAADGLLDMVDDLDWKPDAGQNWMTTGQLVGHMANACGMPCRGFVTGDWRAPEGIDESKVPEGAMLPPAEAMPTATSVEAVREALQADKQLAIELIEQAADRMDDPTAAPWSPHEMPLGQQLLGMVNHLNNHKGQLFYYLKLQGKPVNTFHYYGMAGEPAGHQ